MKRERIKELAEGSTVPASQPPGPGSAGNTAEEEPPAESPPASGHGPRQRLLILTLGALGVVYGDIGTSPLYAIRESFNPAHGLLATPHNVLGVLSLVFWALVLVIVVKYLGFMMRADNRGEGGILALLALFASESGTTARVGRRAVLLLLALFGASLLYGEGVITPAISVLSAVEGLEVVTPRFAPVVVPITIIILTGLFMVQRHGTARVGAIFGPITLLWFLSMAVLGIRGIVRHPQVLAAVSPWYAVEFFQRNGLTGYLVLGAVVLAITGAEALYADMGHFGVKPIRWGWFAVAFPALILNYFGQGALLLTATEPIENPFFALVPRSLLYPMVGIAMAATVIASQALISGAFSLTQQAVQLGYLPRVRIVHTSAAKVGQIYVPDVNKALAVACIALVLNFRSASALAAAYGLAVVGTMAIGTILFSAVARTRWHWSWTKVTAFAAVFLTIELALLGANAVKLTSGAWLPLVLGTATFILMSTWKRGRLLLRRHFERGALPTDLFVRELSQHPPHRVPGAAVFLTANPEGVPPVLLHHLKHNKVLHEKVVLISFLTVDLPHTGDEERV
ncbi:MAG TPA: KUP/HAK/KT family potassium transporter, partial [Longimicrobiales bacterium]|nr:KUP/HAK/KT family potassium transporter [Longimicrobiales bacterium]